MELKGKVALVTGATSGIGAATAEAMAAKGAELFIICRSAEKGRALLDAIRRNTGNEQLSMIVADLSVQADIRRAAAEFLDTGKPLHLLINNAGVIYTERKISADGLEETFAVNHLGYFLLTELLRDRIVDSAPARIVSVASGAHAFCKQIYFDDLNFENRPYKTFEVYGHSKLANILWNRELSRQLEGTGVTANCVHPGAVASGLGKQNGMLGKVITGLVSPFFQSPAKGASTSIYLATSPAVEGVTGKYFAKCAELQPKPWAEDDAAAKRLWDVSRELVGMAG
ncbi:SDR family oxidoreductase [Litorivivens sp.]|uniref:SDR family oxidoreductase n=1 Tax=Litorivivens sp. TaxID=2020868 RepID=UPI0035661E4D